MGHMEISLSVFILTLIGSVEAVCVNHSDFAHCVTLPAPSHSDYYFTSGVMTLPQAAHFCEITHAKHLVFFETQREQADLKDKIRKDNGYIWPSLLPEQFWIGSSFHNLKSYWTFWDQMKGKEMEFSSWQNGHESKAAGKVYFPIGWYKVDPDEQYAVICEEESNMADVLQNLQPFYPTSGTTGPVPTTPAESLGTTQLNQQTTFRPIKASKKATNTSQLCPTQPLTVRHILVKLTSLEVDCGWTRPSSSLTQCVAECLSVEACCGLAYTLSGGMCCGLVHGKSPEALRVDCETDICYRFVSQ